MEFVIQKAKDDETDAIIELIQDIYENMTQKDWYAADNAEYTREMLRTGKGLAYTAREEQSGELAGVFLTAFPGTSKENLGMDIGIREDLLNKVAHMDSVVVSPAYRGHHLQQRLMSYAENDLRHAGYQYLCCTIHPDNQYSMNSALSLGYKVYKTCPKYGGYMRAILMKEIIRDGGYVSF